MKALIRFTILLICCVALTHCASVSISDALSVRINERISSIHEKYGVYVYYKYNRSSFFPASWRKSPVSGYGEQIDIEEVNRLLPLIETFIGKYDQSLIRKELDAIYLLAYLEFYEKSYGGTNSLHSIYITSAGVNENYTDEYILDSLVHEFAGILIRNYSDLFPSSEWEAVNKPDFTYSGTGVEMLGRDDLFEQSEELLQNGFLTTYGQSSLENDFSVYSQWYFNNANALAILVEDYERVKQKYEALRSFYEKDLPLANEKKTSPGLKSFMRILWKVISPL